MVKKSITGMKILYKTPLGETGCSGNHFLFTGCLSIQFFDSPPFPNTVSQAAFGYLPLTVQHLCDLRDAIPHHWSTNASHPTPYLGKQRISLGVAIILSMCLCPHTQLDCNQFAITPRFVFIHVKTGKVLLVVKTLIKSLGQQPQ